MTTPPNPPPGWYPDPRGGISQRWWDGDDWSEVIPDAAIPAPAATGLSKERKSMIFVGAAIAVVAVVGIIMSVVVDDTPDRTTTNAQTTPSPTAGLGQGTLNSPEISEEDKQAAEDRRRETLDPATYRALSERDFALLVKDPAAHKGEKVIVYGEVTQFDAATGTSDFRVNAGPLPPGNGYYSENVFISAAANPDLVADVVNKDLLKMYVSVVGAYSYDTTLGGNTTVPRFLVNIVEHLGQA